MINRPQGMLDFFPEETEKLQYIENTVRDIANRFGFGEIRTPVLESTELFSRGVGNTTDVVQKEMYTFVDRDGPSFSLKPEGTAGVVRAILESGKYGDAMPLKYYYITNCYRHERPQKGRYREFSQFGVEMFGSDSPAADVTVISMADMIIKTLGIKKVDLRINSIGCPKCRPKYHQLLKDYFSDKTDRLCETCKSRLETNPLRILDCKSESCKAVSKGAPKMINCLCEECKGHMDSLCESLKKLGIDYTIDTSIVRGLDYYTKTVFEFVCSDERMGAQSTICGGGRYDGLVEELGGSHLPACGFGMGITRLLPTVSIPDDKKKSVTIYLASLGQKASEETLLIVNKLRLKGVSAECDTMGRSLKAQMKYANKLSAGSVVILGDDEISNGKAVLRNMTDGSQSEIVIDKIADYFTE